MFRSPVLSIPAFRNLWLGQVISTFGDAFYYVVNAFMIKKITGSAAMVGFNGAIEATPFLLVGPYAGILADRLDRRKIMLVSDLLSFSTLMLLAAVVFATKGPPVEAILVNSALLSCWRVFFMPAKNASIPTLVPADQVLQANAVNTTTQSSSLMISLAVSAVMLGLLYALSGPWFYLVSVIVNALSFLGSAVFIRKLPPIIPERAEAKHPFQDFKDGLSYLKRRHVLRVMFMQSMLLNLTIAPFFVAYVAANDAWFGGKPQTLSWFEFSFFAGLVIGSVLVGKMNLRRMGWSAILGYGTVGASVAVMGFTHNVWMFVLWNFLAGVAMPAAQIPSQSFLQLTVPDEFRGRVQSVNTMVAVGVQPIGMSLGGIMLDKAGIVYSFLIMGVGNMLAVLIGLSDREYRTSVLPDSEEAVPVVPVLATENA